MVGLQEVFHSIFPVSDFAETVSIEFVGYSFDEPNTPLVSVDNEA